MAVLCQVALIPTNGKNTSLPLIILKEIDPRRKTIQSLAAYITLILTRKIKHKNSTDRIL